MELIEIWQPRYRDNMVLIATYKVHNGLNRIVFTRDKTKEGKVYGVSGDDIRSCPIESNGKIDCYAVPLSLLEMLD